jgi:hypothetical protein
MFLRLLPIALLLALPAYAQQLYQLPAGVDTRWSSFENPKAAKGAGGAENKGAKGHPAEEFRPGETKTLLDVGGAGMVNRIWLTISDRSPGVLRGIRIEMFWDGAKKPAVSAPLGDFFGLALGRRLPFENALFADPEGRSFNCFIPMPYRRGARIVLVNESAKQVTLFYDVNIQTVKAHAADVLYFHAYWNRTPMAELGQDFEILPRVQGRGRYLGTNIGWITHPLYERSWWGEGEVKIYLDGDRGLPTLNGTGTEDYIGTAWGQGVFAHQYQGCLVADEKARQWAFYRYHIPDPVYFHSDCRVTIQVLGGDMTEKVRGYVANGAQLTPVTVSNEQGIIKLLEKTPVPQLSDAGFPVGWTNFYRQDDVSATAYFYLDKPTSTLPALQDVQTRVAELP